MTGDRLSKEVRALLALTRGDSTGARLALAEPDTLDRKQMMYGLYRRPLAAQAYYLLGDYQPTLRVLQDFEPATLHTAGFDSRWGMLGRVRLLERRPTSGSAAGRRRASTGRCWPNGPPPIRRCSRSSARRAGVGEVGKGCEEV
jgi:hypothetical protein